MPSTPVNPAQTAIKIDESAANTAPAAAEGAFGGWEGRFEGKTAFDNQLLHFLQMAAEERWPELVVGDADFADWAWGSAAAVELLNHWARHGRKITVLACNFDALVRRHPRWVQWRSTWDHRIQCRKYLTRDPAAVPSVLWSPHWVVQRLDAERCVGVASSSRTAIVQQQEVLQEWILRKSTPSFPASVLGL